jgi:hypothetical protein
MNGHPVITVAPLPGGLAVWASAMHGEKCVKHIKRVVLSFVLKMYTYLGEVRVFVPLRVSNSLT